MTWAQRLEQCEGFQWDAANATKIWDKHRVGATECEEVFFNWPLVIGADPEHSTSEERWYAL
jgi:uncharacterized DUF497 family protein